MKKAKNNLWWKGGIIYQIYPMSYMDSGSSGNGTLKGITSKMKYLSSLNIDAIWISPFFKSPLKDLGYDISDYKDIDPRFGTLKDFDALVKKAHQYDIKVMIDQVLSHTSDEHPWFKESKKNKTNSKKDYYVWADAKADGSPPTNWLSIFGGVAWTWNTSRMQYYMHNFLKEQPDLNFHNKEVQEQVLKVVEFWLKRGVDGFRLDTVNFYFHDKRLRNNPPNKHKHSTTANNVNPYIFQNHLYDKSQKENLKFLQRLRALTDRYPNTTLVGEVGDENSLKVISDYTSNNDKLHMAYGFDFLSGKCNAEFIKEKLEYFKSVGKNSWICWSFSNHDVMRAISRWADEKQLSNKAYVFDLGKMLLALLSSFAGSMCIYQGEELALPEAKLKYEDLVDPYGIVMYPEFLGRDGSRTPMVWNDKDGGFSKNKKTWLPIDKRHLKQSVSVQEKNQNSVLNFYRKFLAVRKNNQTLRVGQINIIHAKNNVIVIERSTDEEKILCIINLGQQKTTFTLDKKMKKKLAGNLTDKKILISHNAVHKGESLILNQFGFAYLH